MSRPATRHAGSARPILIIGAPRSGTTLLTTMLNAHSNIYVANESKLLIDFLPTAGASADVAEVARQVVSAAHERGMRDVPALDRLLASPRPSDVAALLERLFSSVAVSQGKVRWGEKTAVAYRRLSTLVRAYPDACFIGLERNPSSVAASYAAINPKWGAAGGLLHWLDFKRAVARQGQGFDFLLVQYHELVSDPAGTLGRVCGFVGESFEAALLQFHETPLATSLRHLPEFAGVANRPYAEKQRAPVLPRWIVDSAQEYGTRLDAERRDLAPPAWEPFLRAVVNMRAATREARASGFGAALAKATRAFRS